MKISANKIYDEGEKGTLYSGTYTCTLL